MDADDGLYDDLDDAKAAKSTTGGGDDKTTDSHKKRKLVTAPQHGAHYLEPQDYEDDNDIDTTKLTNLEAELAQVREENLRLKRNMGTLFRTAKNELRRKDDQLQRLRQELEELQRQEQQPQPQQKYH